MAPVRAIEHCRKDERRVRKGKRRVDKKDDSIRKQEGKSTSTKGSQKGKEKPKTQEKAKQRTNSHNVCFKQLREDASRLKCGEHQRKR